MKVKLILSIMSLSIINMCYSSQPIAEPRLPNPSRFAQLAPDSQLEIFEQYVGLAKGAPELYRLVGRWKQVNHLFEGIANAERSKKAILKKEYDLVNSIKNLCEPSKLGPVYSKRFKTLNDYLISMNPQSMPADREEREAYFNKKLEPRAVTKRLAGLKSILSNMLADFYPYAVQTNMLLFVRALLNNGANPNFETYNETKVRGGGTEYVPTGPALGQVIYKMDATILECMHDESVGKRVQWPNLNLNFALLELLLDKGADPNQIPNGRQHTYTEDINNVWDSNNTILLSGNSHAQEINNYCENVMDLLLNFKATITDNLFRLVSEQAAHGGTGMFNIVRVYYERDSTKRKRVEGKQPASKKPRYQ
jgi:hypothetical protein